MAKGKQKKHARGVRPLVVNRLENVSKEVFKRYFSSITELVEDSPGVYALYDGAELYYVGKSSELRKRVRHHLKDRHYASWTHFSLYLARREDHIHEIESLLVRIANPKGNRVIPRGRSSGQLVKMLKRIIKQSQKEEIADLFGSKRAAGQRARKQDGGGSIAGLVDRSVRLFKTYKGKEFKARLNPKGFITFRGKRYQSPTAAAKAAIRTKRAVNGWTFWYVRDKAGDWVSLKELRK